MVSPSLVNYGISQPPQNWPLAQTKYDAFMTSTYHCRYWGRSKGHIQFSYTIFSRNATQTITDAALKDAQTEWKMKFLAHVLQNSRLFPSCCFTDYWRTPFIYFDDIDIISLGNILMAYAQNTTMASKYLNTQPLEDKEKHKTQLMIEYSDGLIATWVWKSIVKIFHGLHLNGKCVMQLLHDIIQFTSMSYHYYYLCFWLSWLHNHHLYAFWWPTNGFCAVCITRVSIFATHYVELSRKHATELPTIGA